MLVYLAIYSGFSPLEMVIFHRFLYVYQAGYPPGWPEKTHPSRGASVGFSTEPDLRRLHLALRASAALCAGGLLSLRAVFGGHLVVVTGGGP